MMKHYIGIDLGTTNSAICSYDGDVVKTYKSPEQHSVTPSAIYITRRGKLYGARAYPMSAFQPQNTATKFKRLMGTNTPITIPAMKITMTPEECSAEILRVLFGYLPEDIRNDPDTGTVITVPAAFNQMQRDATLAASELAGIGKVALMQEPVAAVMSVMRKRKHDGMFLIYDLGGGTFDIALAESISGRVSLLEHGGISMCGGSDIDKVLVDNVVKPWLVDKFSLPEGFSIDQRYQSIIRYATYAAELAKIDLSSKEESKIFMDESEIKLKDQSGNEIYLDIPITRKTLNELIEHQITETIEATREVLNRAQLTTNDIERIVFIGGPTQYKPIRDLVSFQLGIAPDTQVDPMTAVAEGAAIYAESIDWSTARRSRKTSRGSISAGGILDIRFEYISRTSDTKARIAVRSSGKILPGTQFQIDNLDTGWTSGRLELKDGTNLDLTLTKNGENQFKVFVFDPQGGPIKLEQSAIIITRTSATIDAIPASHSIAVEVRESLTSSARTLDYLVHKGESLPCKGRKAYRASEALRANGPGSIRFNLYENDIDASVDDSEPVGCIKITGQDFDEGIIQPGDELICEFEMSDSGKIYINISIPTIGATIDRDFYSRQEGQVDYSNAGMQIIDESNRIQARIDDISDKVNDSRLEIARDKLQNAHELIEAMGDPEDCKRASENVKSAKKLLSQVRIENLSDARQSELDRMTSFFNKHIREIAKSSEINVFENMAKTAARVKSNTKSNEFEDIIDRMKGMNWQILWRQEWFVIEKFKTFANQDYMFTDKALFKQLVQSGNEALKKDDLDKLRKIVVQLYGIRINVDSSDSIIELSNILKG